MEDYELQAWRLELVADGNPGCGIKVRQLDYYRASLNYFALAVLVSRNKKNWCRMVHAALGTILFKCFVRKWRMIT